MVCQCQFYVWGSVEDHHKGDVFLPHVHHSLWVRLENGVLLPAAEPLAVELEPAPPRGIFSSEGNWKGRDTGTIPPSIP